MMSAADPGLDLRSRLRLRARLRSTVRHYLDARGITEVDTPALALAANPDPAIEPLTTTPASLGRRLHFLQTSPEFAMKRLLAAGSGDIYQLCRVYRDGELGRWHEPEFMLLEWYRVGYDEDRLMDEVADLLNECFRLTGAPLPVARLSYGELSRQTLGVDPHGPPDVVARETARRLAADGIDVPARLSANACLDLAMTALAIPALPQRTIVFIHDYPQSQASLAALKPADPPVAARFEVFVDSVELGNGFRELTDGAEQRERFVRDLATRESAGAVLPPIDEALLAALDRGLPDCAGVALGFDRLVALVAGSARLADAIEFAHSVAD